MPELPPNRRELITMPRKFSEIHADAIVLLGRARGGNGLPVGGIRDLLLEAYRHGYSTGAAVEAHSRLQAVLDLATTLGVVDQLGCSCGRAAYNADGVCPRCEEDQPPAWLELRCQKEREGQEVARRHQLAVMAECPFCGSKPGEVCRTSPGQYSYGQHDHKARYRAACNLLKPQSEASS
jgi:hypothetical protein